MGEEIERKFLVVDMSWKKTAVPKDYCQGYLTTGTGVTVRARVADSKGFLTIKGQHDGISRLEFEYPIPVEEAQQILETLCQKPLVRKKRYRVKHKKDTWEIDEFCDENEGLVLAEIELESKDQQIEKPPWLGREVSHLNRYYNASLITYPFNTWKESDKKFA